jgi:hypothetical protein
VSLGHFEDTKWYSEAVNQRRTYNAMTKSYRIKRQTMIDHKILHRELNIEQHRPHYNRSELCSGKVTVPTSLMAFVVLILLQIW